MKLVVHGLIDKRAEIVGRIEAGRDQLAQLMADLDSLDRSIRIFDPAIDLDDLPSRAGPAAERGVPGRGATLLASHPPHRRHRLYHARAGGSRHAPARIERRRQGAPQAHIAAHRQHARQAAPGRLPDSGEGERGWPAAMVAYATG